MARTENGFLQRQPQQQPVVQHGQPRQWQGRLSLEGLGNSLCTCLRVS
jgi:hypothetical protein